MKEKSKKKLTKIEELEQRMFNLEKRTPIIHDNGNTIYPNRYMVLYPQPHFHGVQACFQNPCVSC